MADFFGDYSNRIVKTLDNPPYQVDSTDTTNVYMRYTSGLGAVLIIRINTTGAVVTYDKVTAAWVDRASVDLEWVPIDTK